MMQQVNLMGDPPSPIDQILSVRTLGAVASTVAVGIVLLTVFITSQTNAVARGLASMEQQQQSSAQALAEFVSKHPEKVPSRLLKEQLDEKSSSLDTLQKLINTLAASSDENRTGFSPYMEGFAQQRIRNLWLTGFELSAGGKFMRINGNASEPKSIPGFLKGLSGEPVFSGRQFSDLTISRVKEPEVPWVSFSVQTKSLEEEL